MSADKKSVDKKRRAAEAALAYVRDGMVLGVGTGSTVAQLIEALKDRKIQLAGAVSSSRRTSDALRAARIPELDLNSEGDLDLYVDGADEATAGGILIKGGGAALTREKVIAAASAKFVCIIDDTKLVEVLGAFPLPVEVIPMARSYVARQLVKLEGQPVWRFFVHRCWGSEYQALPDLDAGANAIALEHIKLENEGWEQDTTLTEPAEK